MSVYTYPPLELTASSFQFQSGPQASQAVTSKKVVIDVTKPSTPEQRKEYIAALQQLYGDSDLVHKQLPAGNPPIFNSPVSAADVPDTHQKVDGFRDFVVTGDVPQFAFKGSHRLNLHLDGAHVDDISVFSRLDPTRCQNCVSRIASGNTRVRGVMTLPHAHVVQLLEKHGLNTADTTDDQVIDLLKKHISAHIVTPVGTKLAEASHGLSDTPLPEGHTEFKEEDHPVLHLHSSRVFMAAPHHHAPHLHEGWVHHGAVLQGQWRFAHHSQ